jgi:competence ComEA-like helix-hairpin-helix protein
MNLRDFLYFSKGERQAFTLLLVLVSIFGILLMVDNRQNPGPGTEMQYAVHPDSAPQAVVRDTIRTLPAPASARPVQTAFRKRNKPAQKNVSSDFPRTEKYPPGTVVDLNTADTTVLKKVPGIGSVYARRIVACRNRLGNFHTIAQLREVYGMDEERYQTLEKWFYIDPSFHAPPPGSPESRPYGNDRQD